MMSAQPALPKAMYFLSHHMKRHQKAVYPALDERKVH